jgi:S-adenosylmethionine decarboxylase
MRDRDPRRTETSVLASDPVLRSSIDLAPDIYRQRLVIEGLVAEPIAAEEICDYLSELSRVVDMVTLLQPVTHRSPAYGWAGWIHWETSGAHFYAWERPRLFFSVDIYTCKAFSVPTAVNFTERYFDALEVSYREF